MFEISKINNVLRHYFLSVGARAQISFHSINFDVDLTEVGSIVRMTHYMLSGLRPGLEVDAVKKQRRIDSSQKKSKELSMVDTRNKKQR